MARESKEDRLVRIHSEAIAEFDKIQSACQEEREQCLQDRRFYSIAGAQWEGNLEEQFSNRPRFEINRTHLAVLRIINEYRNNRITVDFTSKDGRDDDTMADVCDGLYRADEKSSTAEEAYDNAFEEATAGGFGAWRLRADYEDEDDEESDKQRICIEPIHDADTTVFFNLDAKRQDKADAKRCYVLQPYTVDAYKEEFDDDPATWPKGLTGEHFDWSTPDLVWVCELYRVEETKEWVYWFRGLALDDEEENLKRVTQTEIDADPKLLETLQATGFQEVRRKRVEKHQVHKYLMSGSRILEDCGVIAGKYIPIIPVFGKRWVIDGVERCMGHVRLAKDAQRLTNMLMSWLAELASRFDTEKPIFTPEQVARHATMWANDNIERYSYLLADPVKDVSGNPVTVGPIGYTKAPVVPQAMSALLEISTQALNDLLGGQQAGEQLQPNLSGKAVELIQNRLDMQVFIYMSNFARGMKHCGKVWQSMMRDIVVEESRRMKTVAQDGKTGSVVVNQPMIDKETGQKYIENDLSKATFDVDVDVGPSSSSKRAATVRALGGLASITDDPEIKQALTFAILSNIEGEGLDGLHEYARRRSIRMGIIKPTEEEQQELAQEMTNQQPDPQAAYLMAEAQRSAANTGLTVAKTEQAKAETISTLAAIDNEQQKQAIDTARAIQEMTQPPQQ